MDADHELDMAEVTEMTQMISALIEDGHYKDIVENIYNDIGGVVASHVAKLSEAVNEVLQTGSPEAKQKLYEILAALENCVDAATMGRRQGRHPVLRCRLPDGISCAGCSPALKGGVTTNSALQARCIFQMCHEAKIGKGCCLPFEVLQQPRFFRKLICD